MKREKALTEVLRRAHREHGTCVLTLRRLEREMAELRRYVEVRAADPGGAAHLGYLIGVANTVELVEEALLDVFNVRPGDRDASLSARLPRLDGLPPAWRSWRSG